MKTQRADGHVGYCVLLNICGEAQTHTRSQLFLINEMKWRVKTSTEKDCSKLFSRASEISVWTNQTWEYAYFVSFLHWKKSFYLFKFYLENFISPKEFYTTILKFVWKLFNFVIISFIQQGCIKCIKSDSKTFIMLEKICIFQINSVLLNFLFNRKLFLLKIIWSSTTVFNTDNNQKCLLSSKLEWFLKIMWLWRLK